MIYVNNQFVYKLIPWQIYSEFHVCKVLSKKISISWYMYMYILCLRQMFSTEQVPATKNGFMLFYSQSMLITSVRRSWPMQIVKGSLYVMIELLKMTDVS